MLFPTGREARPTVDAVVPGPGVAIGGVDNRRSTDVESGEEDPCVGLSPWS